MRMLIEGPEVSLNGSPTVSPTTVLYALRCLCRRNCLPRHTSWHCPTHRRIRHKDSKYESAAKSADKQSQHTGNTEDKSGQDGSNDCYQRGNHHFALRAFRRDGYTTFIIGFGLTCKDTLYLAELAAYFIHLWQRHDLRHSSSVRRTGKPSSNRRNMARKNFGNIRSNPLQLLRWW